MEYKFKKVSRENYLLFLSIVQKSQWGNILLPDEYSPNLWGGIVIEGNNVIGGWVGTIRGNKPIVKWLAKSVYFDSYPIFVSDDVQKVCQKELIDIMREWAKQEHIVMFNLTHWVRGCNLPYLAIEKNATFLIPLLPSEEEQWNLITSKQRRIIRKAENMGVKVDSYQSYS